VTGHKHAALMLQYAQDAAETVRPWERWENRNPTFNRPDQWGALIDHPEWNPAIEYRRKPKTIRIGEFDVPEPLTWAEACKTLTEDSEVWFVGIEFGEPKACMRKFLHVGDVVVNTRTVHTTREAAELHARALLTLLEPRK
jgi:hypothetical protein